MEEVVDALLGRIYGPHQLRRSSKMSKHDIDPSRCGLFFVFMSP